jgi:hypothetical protein
MDTKSDDPPDSAPENCRTAADTKDGATRSSANAVKTTRNTLRGRNIYKEIIAREVQGMKKGNLTEKLMNIKRFWSKN